LVKLVKSSLILANIAVIITLAARAFLVFQSRTAVVGAGNALLEVPEREIELEVDVCSADTLGHCSMLVAIS